MHFARLQDNRLVERLVLPAITFANENAEQDSVFGEFHA